MHLRRYIKPSPKLWERFREARALSAKAVLKMNEGGAANSRWHSSGIANTYVVFEVVIASATEVVSALSNQISAHSEIGLSDSENDVTLRLTPFAIGMVGTLQYRRAAPLAFARVPLRKLLADRGGR